MSKRQSRLEFWRQMGPASMRKLALAVFFMFAIIGPIQVLMESNLKPLPWSFILIQTVSSGGLAAGIILSMRRKWLLFLVLGLWAAVFIINAKGFIIEVNPGGTQVHFGENGNTGILFSDGVVGYKGGDSLRTASGPKDITQPITLQPAELSALYTQRSYVGILAIMMLSAGYGLFIYVIRTEVRRRARFETEVSIARDIQNSLLPLPRFSNSWCTAAGQMIPATEVGGDYYDMIPAGDDSVIFAVADVTGHGVGAGIISAMTKSALQLQSTKDTAPPTALRALNETLFKVSNDKTFVSCAYLVANNADRTIRISTAGHLPVFQRKAGNDVIVQHRTPSLALGMRPDSTYTDVSLPIARGDMYLLYTDGIVEAANKNGEQFGMERLEKAFSMASADPQDACRSILQGLQEHVGEVPMADDVTLLCVVV